MATTSTKPDIGPTTAFAGSGVAGIGIPSWPRGQSSADEVADRSAQNPPSPKPSQSDALQALLAFSALHEQVRRRKALAARHAGFDQGAPAAEFEPGEQFVLDDVLQLVAERAVAITGADGLAIALAENNQIVLRASAGKVRPDVGARIDRDSAFSGACFRAAQIVSCDDAEIDPRVNVQACRRLGARSMVALPLCGRRRVIGLLEAFSAEPFGFNDSDVRNLSLLAELVVGALRPEDEDRFADSAQVAATKLESTAAPSVVASPSAVASQASEAETLILPVTAEPLETDAVFETETPILEEAAPEPEKIAAVEVAATAAETAAEVAVQSEEPDATPHRPGMVILLVCIVVAVSFAGGVWWKWKTAQLGSEMVQSKAVAAKPVASAAGAPAVPSAVPVATPAAGAGASPETINDENQPLTPATPQELAKFPRVTGIRHWSSADSSTVVLDLEDQVQYEAHRLTGPDRIYFDLHDTQLAPELSGKSIEVGDALLNRVRVAQPVAGMTRVVLETKANSNFSVSLEPAPYRLVVVVSKVGATPQGAVNLFPNTEAAKNRLAIAVPPPTKEDLPLRARVPKLRIVVDAGHGGWDLGTVGRRGLLEKDLVLEIAQRLGNLLETRLGADVILTRNDDNYIPLDDRAEIANQAQADLFVSVHANYSDLPSARGVETYYTNSFSAPSAKDADAHAAGAKGSVTPSLTPADLHERIEQSRRLAASVQRSLYGALSVQNPGLRDRGIKEAGFVVLSESAMPGVLAEVSFVSSPNDEQKLRSDGYREEIAEALYKGIARYAAAFKGVKVASAGK